MEISNKPIRILGSNRYLFSLCFIVIFWNYIQSCFQNNASLMQWVKFFSTCLFRKWQFYLLLCWVLQFQRLSLAFFTENNQWFWQIERGGYHGIFWCILVACFREAVPVSFFSLICFYPGIQGKLGSLIQNLPKHKEQWVPWNLSVFIHWYVFYFISSFQPGMVSREFLKCARVVWTWAHVSLAVRKCLGWQLSRCHTSLLALFYDSRLF